MKMKKTNKDLEGDGGKINILPDEKRRENEKIIIFFLAFSYFILVFRLLLWGKKSINLMKYY